MGHLLLTETRVNAQDSRTISVLIAESTQIDRHWHRLAGLANFPSYFLILLTDPSRSNNLIDGLISHVQTPLAESLLSRFKYFSKPNICFFLVENVSLRAP